MVNVKIKKRKTQMVSKAEQMQLHREQIFQDKNYWKAIFKMVFPTMLATIITATYQVIDKLITTNFATGYLMNKYNPLIANHEVAKGIINIAMNYASVIMAMTFAFSLLISVGTSIKCSIALGQKNEKLVKENVGTGIISSLILAIILTIVMWFLAPIIIGFQSSNEPTIEEWKRNIIKDEALNYAHMITLGTLLLFGANFWIMLFRCEGRVIALICISLFTFAANIGLDFAVVFNFGLTGTAFGSLVIWLINIVVALYIVYTSKSHFRITWKHLRFRPRLTFGILSLGVVSLLENITEAVIIMFTANLIHYLPKPSGWDPQTAVYVSLSAAISPWLIILNSPMIGLGYGARALLGYAYGQKRYDRIWNYLWRLFIFLFAMLTILIIGIATLSPLMLKAFGVGHEIADHFWYLMLMQFGFYPLASFSYVGIVLFQSTGRPRLSLFFGIQRTIVMPIICITIGFNVAKLWNDGFYYYLFIGFVDLFACSFLLPILATIIYRNRHYFFQKN